MPRPRHNRKSTPDPITPMEFVGAQMANFLYAVANYSTPTTPAEREQAKKLYERWDRISRFTLNNPIVNMELEEKFFPKGK